jgi:hypothetical protein
MGESHHAEPTPTPIAATLVAGLAAAIPPVVLGVAFLGRHGWDRDGL